MPPLCLPIPSWRAAPEVTRCSGRFPGHGVKHGRSRGHSGSTQARSARATRHRRISSSRRHSGGSPSCTSPRTPGPTRHFQTDRPSFSHLAARPKTVGCGRRRSPRSILAGRLVCTVRVRFSDRLPPVWRGPAEPCPRLFRRGRQRGGRYALAPARRRRGVRDGSVLSCTGNGVGAATALRRARLDAIDAGRPAAVWAGLVLAGDGRHPPFPALPGPPPFSGRVATILSATVLVGLAAVAFGLRRRATGEWIR